MIIIVCGGRDYVNRIHVFSVLSELHSQCAITGVVNGGAHGADSLATEWADSVGVKAVIFFPDWRKYKNSAGPIRNRRMASESRAELCVAFPGGRGTQDMIDAATERGISVMMAAEDCRT